MGLRVAKMLFTTARHELPPADTEGCECPKDSRSVLQTPQTLLA